MRTNGLWLLGSTDIERQGGSVRRSPTLQSYWRRARTPRYSLSFALPLLAAYEALAFVLSRFELAAVRNGADVLLKNVFAGLGGRHGLAAFGAVLVGGAVAIIWRDVRRSGKVEPRYFLFMAGESMTYALAFGVVASRLTQLLLPILALSGAPAELAAGYQASLSLPSQLMISLGAGIYEELLFRVLLVSGLTSVALHVFRWSRAGGTVVAVILAALIFSAFHYLGPYGDSFRVSSFTFRTLAGLLFSGLYVLRGFGITAWTHALYDIFLELG